MKRRGGSTSSFLHYIYHVIERHYDVRRTSAYPVRRCKVRQRQVPLLSGFPTGVRSFVSSVSLFFYDIVETQSYVDPQRQTQYDGSRTRFHYPPKTYTSFYYFNGHTTFNFN